MPLDGYDADIIIETLEKTKADKNYNNYELDILGNDHANTRENHGTSMTVDDISGVHHDLSPSQSYINISQNQSITANHLLKSLDSSVSKVNSIQNDLNLELKLNDLELKRVSFSQDSSQLIDHLHDRSYIYSSPLQGRDQAKIDHLLKKNSDLQDRMESIQTSLHVLSETRKEITKDLLHTPSFHERELLLSPILSQKTPQQHLQYQHDSYISSPSKSQQDSHISSPSKSQQDSHISSPSKSQQDSHISSPSKTQHDSYISSPSIHQQVSHISSPSRNQKDSRFFSKQQDSRFHHSLKQSVFTPSKQHTERSFDVPAIRNWGSRFTLLSPCNDK